MTANGDDLVNRGKRIKCLRMKVIELTVSGNFDVSLIIIKSVIHKFDDVNLNCSSTNEESHSNGKS